jgi:hypothetical protein
MTEEGVLPTPDYEILNLKQTPIPLRFTWARQAVLPCRLGVRKDVFVGPVQLRAKADVLVPSGQFVWGFSVRVRFIPDDALFWVGSLTRTLCAATIECCEFCSPWS